VDLSLSEDELLLQSTVRSFVQKETTVERLVEVQEGGDGSRTDWTSTMVDAGWVGAVVAGDFGGVGASTLEAAVICEELGRGPVPGPFLASSVVSALLIGAADASTERDEILSGIASGEMVVSPALTAARSSWDGVAGVQLSSGPLPFVPHAGAATHVLVPAAGDLGIELIVVPMQADGVERQLLDGLLAWNYEVTLPDDVRSRASGLLPVDRDALDGALRRAYVLVSAYAVGGCQAVVERSIDYSNTRLQFGQKIGRFQRVQDHVVELVNATDAARWTTYEAIWAIDSGRPAAASAHLAKATASQSYWTATDYAHKVHGGIGVDPQYGLTLYTQMSRTLYDFLGGPRWHKRRMIDALVA
jgi:alkylation response protein AidB-like acyl-CoA dehydrogenase